MTVEQDIMTDLGTHPTQTMRIYLPKTRVIKLRPNTTQFDIISTDKEAWKTKSFEIISKLSKSKYAMKAVKHEESI